MADNLVWDGPAMIAKIEAEVGRRLDAAAILLVNHEKVKIGIEGAGKSAPGRGAGGRFTKGKLRYGANPSRPGEPPHKQTGRLQGSVAWERTGLVARVGTNVFYGKILELYRDRPWLLVGLQEKQAEIEAILSKPMDF